MSRCPQPEKIAHDSPQAAEKHRRALLRRGASTDLCVYRCNRHWHVGHSAIKLRQRIRSALRARYL